MINDPNMDISLWVPFPFWKWTRIFGPRLSCFGAQLLRDCGYWTENRDASKSVWVIWFTICLERDSLRQG